LRDIRRIQTLSHPPILETRQLTWPNEAACGHFAVALAGHGGLGNATIELDGPLGAGKTTFVRHLLRALGVQGRIKSPTYAVVEPYEVPFRDQAQGHMLAISHFDFYRFTDPREWEDAGFRELFAAPGLKLCEWAEKVAPMLPMPDLRLTLEVLDDDRRQVRADAYTATGQGLLK
jgi:tRNA threonylcarbamoyladenosine biosynthesis protein TsaE